MTLAACGAGHASGAGPADLVLVARRIVTLDPERPSARALAVRDGRVVWLGDADAAVAQVGPRTQVLHRPDAVVVPGLVDSHAHLMGLGRSLSEIDVVGTPSAAAVAAAVAAAPAGPGWILGRGWDQNDWEDTAFPTHAPLTAAAPDRPVALRRIDGHALWLNAAALRLAGIDASTPDPADGRILRDADGAPTGVLIDGAMGLALRHVPEPDDAQVRAWVTRAVEACHAVGLTGVHDAGATAQTVRVYRQMAAEGALPLRVHVLLDADDPAIGPLVAAGPVDDPVVAVRGVKLFADGALGSRGAWLSAPYADAPDTDGIRIVHGEALRAAVARYAGAGFQVGVHAIGDAAATDALDAFEAAGLPVEHGRFRLEHAQIVRPADQARMARLGVLAMVQPTHATSDMPWAEARLGPERIRWAYAWQSLRRAGVTVALGSDFPVERPAPLAGLYAAITRQDADGQPAGGWYPAERLSPAEALAGFTVDAARAGLVAARRGRLAPGFDADLTLLSVDPLTAAPPQLRAARVLGVVVAGRTFLDPDAAHP